VLTDVEYRYIIRHRAALQQEIDSAESEEKQYNGLKVAAHDRKVSAEGEMSLYTNFLKEAIDEYEAAHPPETHKEK